MEDKSKTNQTAAAEGKTPATPVQHKVEKTADPKTEEQASLAAKMAAALRATRSGGSENGGSGYTAKEMAKDLGMKDTQLRKMLRNLAEFRTPDGQRVLKHRARDRWEWPSPADPEATAIREAIKAIRTGRDDD